MPKSHSVAWFRKVCWQLLKPRKNWACTLVFFLHRLLGIGIKDSISETSRIKIKKNDRKLLLLVTPAFTSTVCINCMWKFMPIIVSGQTSSSICISNIDKRHSSSNCCIVTSENRLKILLLKYHTSSCLWKMLAAGGEHVVSSASTQQNLLVHWMQWSSRTVSCQHVLPLTAEVIDVT